MTPLLSEPTVQVAMLLVVFGVGVSMRAPLMFVICGVLAFVWFVPAGQQIAFSPQATPLPNVIGARSDDELVDLIVGNVQTHAPNCLRYIPLAASAADKEGIDPLLLLALWNHESGCDPNAVNNGQNGTRATKATGLGQVMPSDAYVSPEKFSNRPTSAELKDPELNAMWSASILEGALRTNDSLYDALNAYSGGHGQGFYDSVTSIYEKFTRGIAEIEATSKPPGEAAPSSNRFVGFEMWPYGKRTGIGNPFKRKNTYQSCGYHTGIDTSVRKGAPLYAVADGLVLHGAGDGPFWNSSRFRGSNPIVIAHATDGENYLMSVYSHNDGDRVVVRTGQRVEAGDLIGYESDEGYSTGGRPISHLHFEVYYGRYVGAGKSTTPFGLTYDVCHPGWLNPTDFLPT